MLKILWVLMPLVLIPGTALAQQGANSGGGQGPGSGTDIYKVWRETEAMQRDGRWEELIAEGRANRQAFENMGRSAPAESPSAVGSVTPRRR